MIFSNQFSEFKLLINEFKEKVDLWKYNNPGLLVELDELKKNSYASAKEKGSKNSYEYVLENSIVYNNSLDRFTKKSNIKYIIVADNPGKNEQLNSNLTYLIGQAGKLARSFLIKKTGLISSFENEILVLNKTPIHTVKTSDLKRIKPYKPLIDLSQQYMASLVYNLHKLFGCELWIIGYTELKKGKTFESFLNEIVSIYNRGEDNLKQKVSVFRHFSTNSFLNDFNKRYNPDLSVEKNLDKIGKELYRKEYLGW